jgi:periplasmic protein TonB
MAGIPASDRLPWAVFLATTLHGLVILGVGFTPDGRPGPSEVPTLEVTLLQDPRPDEHEPENPDFLAQAHQQGAGTTHERVTPDIHANPPAPEPEPAQAPALSLRFAAVASRHSRARAVVDARPAEEARPERQQPPEGGLTQVSDEQLSERFVAVNTRESEFAEYLAAWKARMERLGTVNFPAAARREATGRPVVEVAVARDGTLHEVRATRTSGNGAIDRAAEDLVRLGSPFDPFPPQIRYDVLRFAYEWRFLDGRVEGSGVYAPDVP